MNEKNIQSNLFKVQENVRAAANRSGRDPDDIKIVVVTKTHSADVVKEAYKAGVRMFGENYPDEAKEKIESCRYMPGIEWHMIGHIQSRKVKIVANHFAYVHSIDRLKVAYKLDLAAKSFGRCLPVLLEFNVTGEESKFGWAAWETEQWSAFLEEIDEISHLGNLAIHGIMTMEPFTTRPEDCRPYYRKLTKLRQFLTDQFPETNFKEISMGMSTGYEVAVEEGATFVRIGTAILGPRE